jgi:hypothetical protein
VFAGRLFPFLFITIACGAVSGWHSIIASGTTPKLLANEGQARLVGYGGMLMEAFVAMMALIAAAPAAAPASVQGIIAAGNQIVGKPYVYGGGHGLPLDVVAPAYDCSSSVAHLLYGGGLLPAGADLSSGDFEHWGDPGPGRWVTIYASATHVFMYVAGLRWDTWNAAGPGDGTQGIGWHPLVRSAAGFVARHPPGL